MIVVHHLENSRSQRILWMLEELGVEYRVERYDRDPQTQLAPPELVKIHPLGKSPVITDGDAVIAESGAIVEYLSRVYGNEQWSPQVGSPAYNQYLYWLHYAEGSFMPPLLLNLVFNKIKTTKMPFFVKPIAKGIADKVLSSFVTPNINRHLAFIEQYLSDHEWFAGDKISGADIQMSFPLEAAVMRETVPKSYVNIRGFVDRVQARDAYKRALSTGGPYNYA